tara:strand:- start:1244 stop:1741 length:498 start_codon:yes stop_codon:yes gene_type:complete
VWQSCTLVERGEMLTLQHITINTKDIDKSMEFYEEVFSFIKTERPCFPFPGAWYWIEPKKTMLHIQHTDRSTPGHFPVDHIALDATEPGENVVDEYERWAAFLTRFYILNKWSLNVEFHSFAPSKRSLDVELHSFYPEKFLQIFITDPINSVKWELNFPIEKLQR